MKNEKSVKAQKPKKWILCPGNYATGGVELLHQLAHEIDGTIWYRGGGQTPDAYEMYHNTVKTDKHPPQGAVVILPEIWAEMADEFERPVIYWESVDNYLIRKTKPIPDVELHLTQSIYAYHFLREQGIPDEKIIPVTDYLHAAFMSPDKRHERLPLVLYNPAKGMEYTQRIIQSTPDIRFAPIEKMTREEVIDKMDRARVYIDFGNHPGKDRLPREAAMRGLCVITGRNGSAPYDIDIPDLYKIERTDVERIKGVIRMCVFNYEKYTKDFDGYRESIRGEYAQFREGCKRLLCALA